MTMIRLWCGLGLTMLLMSLAAAADERAGVHHQHVQPFLERHCAGCHNDRDRKGDISFGSLTAAIGSKEQAELWQAIRSAVRDGDMPPKDRPRPNAAEASKAIAWIEGALRAAEQQLASQTNPVVLRRLNRFEYENTLRDLFYLPYLEVATFLPEDTKRHAFDNNGQALDLGNAHLDGFLAAIDQAIAGSRSWDPKTGKLPANPYAKTTKVHGLVAENLDEQEYVKQTVTYSSHLQYYKLPYARRTLNFNAYTLNPKQEGLYRLTLRHYVDQGSEATITVTLLDTDPKASARQLVVDQFHVTATSHEKPAVYTREFRLERGQSLKFTSSLPNMAAFYTAQKGFKDPRQTSPKATAEYFAKGRSGEDYEGALKLFLANKRIPAWAIMSEEVEGPLEFQAQWPPASHSMLYGEKNREALTESDVLASLKAFIPRAFRRPVEDREAAPYLQLVRDEIAHRKTPPYRAIEVGLRAVLISPAVVYLEEKPGVLDQYALASRLSYFLWSAPPDELLLADAKARKLQGAGLRAAVERMLASPKARALEDRFLTLWLNLDQIDATSPDMLLYPEFNDDLKSLMVQETKLFFRHLVTEDLSARNIVDSDFTFLNDQLAGYYGIRGVEGHALQKTMLKPADHRGGLITHGSVLKVTANGTETSPILRGVWLSERILGKPIPPPPISPPAITPDTRGAVTIREQLALHRNNESCNVCHRKIDPLGFALESYDPAGAYRTYYRTLGDAGKPVKAVHSKRQGGVAQPVKYRQGRDVELGGSFADGESFRDLAEFKQILLRNDRLIGENLARQLLAYAIGRELDFGDQQAIEAILHETQRTQYGVRSLIHAIVQSKPFQTK